MTPSPALHWFGFKQDWPNRVVKPKALQQSRSESMFPLQPDKMCFMATRSPETVDRHRGCKPLGLTHVRVILVLIDDSTPHRNLDWPSYGDPRSLF